MITNGTGREIHVSRTEQESKAEETKEPLTLEGMKELHQQANDRFEMKKWFEEETGEKFPQTEKEWILLSHGYDAMNRVAMHLIDYENTEEILLLCDFVVAIKRLNILLERKRGEG